MSSLTGRGKLLLIFGLICVAAGWVFGQSAAVAVGALLVALPALGTLTVRRARFALDSSRSVAPAQVPVGSEAEIVLTIENSSRVASGVLLLRDDVPEGFTEAARIVFDRVPPRARRSQRYRVTAQQRGRTRIGPLSVTVTDPFGTAALTRRFTETTPVVVTPRVVALQSAGESLTPGGQGDSLHRSLAAWGDDDVLPREHRPGDDMRRIHWRATARYGEIMVRRDEQARHSSLVVLVDDRASAHTGSGLASTFEWAVSAAASITLHYQRSGWRVLVVRASGSLAVDTDTAMGGAGHQSLLDAFADLRPTAQTLTSQAELDVTSASAVVAIMGRLSDDAASTLIRPAGGFAGCLALDPAPTDYLRARGWRVAAWSRGTSVAQAWSDLTAASVTMSR